MAESKPAALAGAAAPSFVVVTERVRPNAKLIGLLALGHLVIDVNQGSLPAILPFLRVAHGLSYAEAGAIVLAGPLADRWGARPLMTWALLLGVALLGAVADQWGLPVVLWLCALLPLPGVLVSVFLLAPRDRQ